MRERLPILLPLAILGLALVGVPIAAFTNTAPERFVREQLGTSDEGCVPRTAESPGWRAEHPPERP